MSEYVTVERADNEAMADLIRQRLEENGIPCILQSGRMAGIAGAGASYEPPEHAEIVIRPEPVEASAQRLLEAIA